MDEFEFNGNKIERRDDGSFKVTTPEGTVLIMDKDGNIKGNIKTITRVGIENVFDVRTHTIMREGELTVHKMEFHDGGRVKLAYTTQGEIKEFTCTNIGQTITKEGAIIIRSSTAAKET